MSFEIKIKDNKTKARIGILKTKSGIIESPFFMPVASKASVKYVNSDKLEEIGVKAVISNAFILSLRSIKIFRKFRDIGNFMNFNGINFTDSGGFQMYSKSIFVSSNENGVWFRNPINGKKIFMTPEENMRIQNLINGDVALCLDHMPLYGESKKEIEEAVRKTSLWAIKCKIEHNRLQKKINYDKRQLLFGITQGGIYSELRERSIKELLKLDFDGYSIGGFGLGEDRKDEYKIIKLHKEIINENKPIYLMGIGDPVEILEAIGMGCDIFDSRMPTQNARRGTLFTSKGKLKILNKKYENDKNPIDKNCRCFVCNKYSKAYVRFLLKEEESVGKELASYHNIYYLINLINESKKAIREGKFESFKNRIKMIYE